jgi:peptide deformylase
VSSGVISDGFLHEDVDVDADTTEMQSSFLQESEEALIGGPFSAAGLAANKIKVKKNMFIGYFTCPYYTSPLYNIIYIPSMSCFFRSEACLITGRVRRCG